VNDRVRAAFLADLAVLVQQVEHPGQPGEVVAAFYAAELRLRDYCARGHPSGCGEGVSSSDVSDPTFRAAVAIAPSYERDRDDLDHALSMASFHAKLAARIVGRMRPVPALQDAPDAACGNMACPNVCTGKDNDRIVKPKGSEIGLCPRCRKHWERHKRQWPKDRDGRDVRGHAA
jgi:hypothetical protein